MQYDNWESGRFLIPAKAWAAFRKQLRGAVNNHREHVLDVAVGLYDGYFAQAADVSDEIDAEEAALLFASLRARLGEGLDRPVIEDVIELFFVPPPAKLKARGPVRWGANTMRRPTRAALDVLLPKATERSHEFILGLGRISLITATRSVTWSVQHAPFACERAREHPVARALFAMLDEMRWTRGTGGAIYGNSQQAVDHATASGHPVSDRLKSWHGPDLRTAMSFRRLQE